MEWLKNAKNSIAKALQSSNFQEAPLAHPIEDHLFEYDLSHLPYQLCPYPLSGGGIFLGFKNMNVFAAALSKPLPQPAPPADFNIKVSQLRPTRAAALTRAVHEGQLDGYYCEGQLWVRRVDIHELLPPGHCTYDETDACCFIPG